MAVNEGTLSFDNEEVQAQEMRNFSDDPPRILRFEEGRVYRVHFFSKDVLMRRRHFQETEKKYYRCLDHLGYCPTCVAASKKMAGCKRASDSFGTNLFVYATDEEGQLLDVIDADIHFWAFGADKFTQLREIMKEHGDITQLDLYIACVDLNFQQMKITVADECLFFNEDVHDALAAKIEKDCYPVDKFLCREVSMIEMCEVFNLDINRFIPSAILDRIAGSAGSGGNTSGSSSQGSAEQSASSATQSGTAPASAGDEANFEDISNIAGLL